MSNCDYKKNKLEIGYPITTANAKKPIGDWLFITTVAAAVVRIFFWPKVIRRRTVWCIISIYVVGMV